MCSSCILVKLKGRKVYLPIKLDCQFLLRAIKVYNVITDTVLSSEFPSA